MQTRDEVASLKVEPWINWNDHNGFRKQLGYLVESISERLLRWSVKLREPQCKCAICRRYWNAVLEQAEETGMQLCYARDQLEELWAEHGLTTGEMR